MEQRKNRLLGLALTVFLGLLPAAVFSQEAQPQLLLMGAFLVDTSRVAAYETAVKELLANLEKHGFSYLLDTYSTDDSHYYMVYSLKNYADADSWFKAWADLAQKMGPENLQALPNSIVAAEIERVYQIWYYPPDISLL